MPVTLHLGNPLNSRSNVFRLSIFKVLCACLRVRSYRVIWNLGFADCSEMAA